MADAARPTVLDLIETALMEARREAAFCAGSAGLANRPVQAREIGLRAAVARKALIDRIEEMHAAAQAIEALDRRIDDAEHDGQGAVTPTGEDYKQVVAIVRSQFSHLITPGLID